MFPKKTEIIVPVNQLPNNLQPDCLFPRLVALMTYREKNSQTQEVLNVKCKSRLCLNSRCRLKDITDL